MKEDFYKILELTDEDKKLTGNAFNKVLKKKYRELSKRYHPDVNPDSPDAETKFKLVSEAYENLSDQNKRDAYDRFGHNGTNNHFNDFDGFNTDDLFSRFQNMYGNRQRNKVRKGSNITVRVNLTLEEMFNGIENSISFTQKSECSSCNGKGGTTKPCESCNGLGQTTHRMGHLNYVQTCHTCKGTGHMVTDNCNSCHGAGHKSEIKTMPIKLPAGIEEGTYEYPNEGNKILNGVNGDLHIIINQKPHDKFVKEGIMIVHELKVPYYDLLLGCKKQVPTIDGVDVTFTIPKLTKNGYQFRLNNRGFHSTFGRGPMIVVVSMIFPEELSETEEVALNQIKNANENLVNT